MEAIPQFPYANKERTLQRAKPSISSAAILESSAEKRKTPDAASSPDRSRYIEAYNGGLLSEGSSLASNLASEDGGISALNGDEERQFTTLWNSFSGRYAELIEVKAQQSSTPGNSLGDHKNAAALTRAATPSVSVSSDESDRRLANENGGADYPIEIDSS